jgi:hypothetical protein
MADPSQADKDILSTARSRMKMAISAYSDSREDELDDLKFAAGSPDNHWQWPADVLATRGSVQGQTINARPSITINKLPQHIKQVTNEQRQNRPSGKVIPVDADADVEMAEVYDGMIRHIEYISDADVAYDTACDNQVTFGEGYFRILTKYCSDDSFDQDLFIGRIRNSFSVYMDPMMQDPCGADATWCFVTEDLLKEEYERRWPNATPLSSLEQAVGDDNMTQWISEDTVRVADYYYIAHEKQVLNLYPGNRTVIDGSREDGQLKAAGLKPLKTRTADIKKVKCLKINGYEILESADWAGPSIPVIRVIGNEFEVEGRMYVSGLVRNAKDAQRMYNYWVSQEAEMLALAPKAPFIGYGGQFEGYENQWKTANTQNYPYLEVNPDVTDGQGNVLPLPQRAQPPMASSGLLQAKAGANDDIKGTTGQYDSSIGATSNERSGKAILAREKQSDTGTYHYVDNLARAVRYCSRQLVELIPKIYDTQRIARIIGLDGEVESAEIDPTQDVPVRKIVDEQGITIKKVYNPGVGKYDVRVTTGPSYMTKRQETLEAMSTLLQSNPQLWQVAGDLFIKNMDWPGATEMAERFAKTIDPKFLKGDDQTPEMQAAQQQISAMGEELDKLHKMLQNVQQSFEAKQLDNEHFRADIDAFKAETQRLTALSGSAAAAPVSEDIQAVVRQYIQDILSQPTLEEEEPKSFEQGEMHSMGQEMPFEGMDQQQPPPGGIPPQQPLGA